MSSGFRSVLIIGPGLIGGSFALALRAAGLADSIHAADSDARNLAAAVKLGIVDSCVTLESARTADLVVVAVPVGAVETVLSSVAPFLGERTVVTDVGSSKSDVVVQARRALGEAFERFVPGHPISGSDASGAGAASGSLFRGKKVVLTPVEKTVAWAVDRVASAWRACGAEVELLAPEEHDRILAVVSHLPHVIAYALVERVGMDSAPQLLLEHSAGAFRDVTRIAASSPELWRDVCLSNGKALMAEIEQFQGILSRISGYIERRDGAQIEKLFADARRLKERFGNRGAKGFRDNESS